ncbi:MAG: HD domain-containing protein [Chloroherpetonaceae bacterium]|nr:HD domain-containing protein [Chloroherpetonaceae bacterium]
MITSGLSLDPAIESVLERIRQVTAGTPYEGTLYLVGGVLRDHLLGVPHGNDLDLVLEGDALALARFLHQQGVTRHAPVTYPRFGTAMVHILSQDGTEWTVELVSARAERYSPDSRKPEVRQGTLQDDVLRRDFTINTLLQNLHSGQLLDLTCKGLADLRSGIIRTPLEPRVTFFDDPLRMLRAIRFAARFEFTIETATWSAIVEHAGRLQSQAISAERIRDEFLRIVRLPGPKFRRGMELLLTSRLLEQFLPEMLPMAGCTQGTWHIHDVWTHTLITLECLPDDAPDEVRLALLWHDIGKPSTRSEDATGIHFFHHAKAGAEITRELMTRLRFPNDVIKDVTALIAHHMRPGEYRTGWSDAAVKRLIRDCGEYLERLLLITQCDRSGINIPPEEAANLDELRARIERINALSDVARIDSPLNGHEIMQQLGVGRGPHLRAAKDFLINEILEGRLSEGDKQTALQLLTRWWQTQQVTSPDQISSLHRPDNLRENVVTDSPR